MSMEEVLVWVVEVLVRGIVAGFLLLFLSGCGPLSC